MKPLYYYMTNKLDTKNLLQVTCDKKVILGNYSNGVKDANM